MSTKINSAKRAHLLTCLDVATEAAITLAEESRPYVCPGCYAFCGERCASWCPGLAIERSNEYDRETREMYPDIDGDEWDEVNCD